MSHVCLFSLWLFVSFSHCFLRALFILTVALLSMLLCSLVRGLECWQQSGTLWNDNLGAAWMNSPQDQPPALVLFSWHHAPACYAMGQKHEERDGEQHSHWQRISTQLGEFGVTGWTQAALTVQTSRAVNQAQFGSCLGTLQRTLLVL